MNSTLLQYYFIFISILTIVFIIQIKSSYKIIILLLLLFIIIINKNKNELFQSHPFSFQQRMNYDNLYLKPNNNCWRKEPSNTPLIKPTKNMINMYNEDYPTVDGTKNTPKSLFTFAYNKCSPACCPSTFSCDKGCVCTTEQQRKFIHNRGII